MENKTVVHYVKSIRIRSYSGPHFPAFGLNAERYSVSLRIQSECVKIQTRITPNKDTFYAVVEASETQAHMYFVKYHLLINVLYIGTKELLKIISYVKNNK